MKITKRKIAELARKKSLTTFDYLKIESSISSHNFANFANVLKKKKVNNMNESLEYIIIAPQKQRSFILSKFEIRPGIIYL